MKNYDQAYAEFDLGEARAAFSDPAANEVNAAVECCDRWCGEDRPALYWASEDGARGTWTFEQLREASSRFANLLASLDVGPGDRVAALLPRTPDLLIAILAVWRLGAVYQPLFTAFGPKAIGHRLATAETKVVITDSANRAKLHGIEVSPRVLLTQRCEDEEPEDLIVPELLAAFSSEHTPVSRKLDDPFLIMFTSGTTGAPKSLLVPLKAIAAFVGYMRDAVDLRPEDRFWNIADPGWAYGLYYAVAGPLAMGHATLFYDGPFTAKSTVAICREFDVTNLAGSPTAYRLLMAAGPDELVPLKGRLRVVSSAGEALNPEVTRWFATHLAAPIYDHYGQTELGMVVCNHHALRHPVTPGSAGFPVPGHRVVVIDGSDQELPPHNPGILAVDRTQSPLFWFGGYGDAKAESESRYYHSGDMVELNEDGSISFVGRADDVITSSGYRIGPFDVESALMEHPATAEVAVVGKPDPERTEIVKAFIVLGRGHAPGEDLVRELQLHVRSRLSAHAYPREIEFIDELPKTPSGKIQRFLLRAGDKAVD